MSRVDVIFFLFLIYPLFLFFQIERTICNIVQSDRFWSDLSDLVTVFEPCLYILRLADRQSPAMDELYYYVRRMDAIVELLKAQLNETEDKYEKQPGPNLETKIANYFLRSKEKTDLKPLFTVEDKNALKDVDDDDSSVESSDEGDLEDDMQSLDGSEDLETEDNRCGTHLESIWKKRSIALRTDIAIAGWMCCPHAEIMEDCKLNHTGDHKNAVTRLLKNGIHIRYVNI